MKDKIINVTHIEGLLHSHDLKLKVSGENSKNPGTEFISGNVNIATDDACLNVVPVHFTYVTAVTSKGAANATFNALNSIINGAASITKDGKDNAIKLDVDSAIALNEWYQQDGTLVSVKRNEGGFVHLRDTIEADETKRSRFEVDMVITNTERLEADDDKKLPERVVVKGAIFNFRKELLPVDFTVLNAAGMNHFEKMDASKRDPIFTKVWGRQVSQTVRVETVEESAFGEAMVRVQNTSKKDFVITGTARETYLFGDEDCLTSADLTEKAAARETYLATIKKNQEEWQAQKKSGSVAASTSTDEYGF